jgi:hypothetical protein
MPTSYERFCRKKSECRRKGILFTLTRHEFREIEERYKPRGRRGWRMVEIASGKGFVPGNIEMISAVEHFRLNMHSHYGVERDYLP